VLGVTDVTSDSIPGLSAIDLHFAPGTNLYQARQLVQERLTSAFILPNVSKPPVMLQPLSSSANVMIIGLTSSTFSQVDLSVLSRWTIVPRLLGVSGVANVSTFGQADLQLQVQVNPAVLAAHHLTIADIVDATGNSQLVTPLSYLEGSTPGADGFLEDTNQRITIRHVLPFGTPANLEQIPVGTVDNKPLLLGSVATVANGHQPLIGDSMVGADSNGLVLVVQKLPNASVTSVTSGLDQALKQLGPSLSGVRVDATLFRPATYLAGAGSNDRSAAIGAAVLAVIALLLLLLSFRFAFVCLAAIAMSLISATLVLKELGYVFSSIVLLGLLLALAVVVQDAAGSTADVMAAMAADGGDGPGLSVTTRVAQAYRGFARSFSGTSVAALVCVAPLFVASGLTARFLRPMVLAFGLGVITSMIVALLVSPALSAIVLSVGTKREPFGLAMSRRMQQAYSAVLRRSLGLGVWPLAALCVLAAAGIGVTVPLLHPGPPVYQDRDLDVTWTGAAGMSLPELNRITALADRELLAAPGVQQVGATLGRAATSNQLDNTNSGQLWIELTPTANYARTVAAVTAIVSGTPGMRGTVSTYEEDSAGGVLSSPPGDADVRVYGPNLNELIRLAYGIRSMMSGVRGLGPPHIQAPVTQPTINVEVNSDAAKVYGLTPGDVRREAGTLMLGLTVGNYFQSDKVFDVVVRAQPDLVANLSGVRDLPIDDGIGGEVPLGTVATVSVGSQPVDIKHDQFSPYLDITAPVTSGRAADVDAAIGHGLARLSFPLEYRAEVQGHGDNGTSRGQFISFLVAAFAGLVLIAQAVLGSWRSTLVTMAAILPPVAASALVAWNMGPASLSAAAGVLAVVAIALRQAIGVAARIRRRHVGDGGELTGELLVTGAAESTGSAVISAVVTILALVPFIAVGETAGTETIHGAAIVIVCGLIVATLVNLLVLPMAVLKLGPTAPVPADADEDAGGDMAWVTAARSSAL
jgi:multidrug efflux pump subunit AcrB